MAMKRLFRSPEKFEVINLFTSLGRTHGFSLSGNGGQDKFLQIVKNSFDESLRNPMVLHGRRTQAMFSYVAASLGRASLIKEEDAGEFFVADPDLKIPDFHIVLLDGSSFLVEVKNYRHDLRKPMILKIFAARRHTPSICSLLVPGKPMDACVLTLPSTPKWKRAD
jgi:hypothetical protein